MSKLPMEIFSGNWKYGHCQGIAVDTKREFIYYSFTTALIKTDMSGRPVGSVTGLMGHLGCIEFNDDDGRVYGSLEYKNDAIGRGILSSIGYDGEVRNAFYIARFDVEKIDRMDMDACRDGVMRSVYLKEVVDDYLAVVERDGQALAHRHGCSGIDGTTFGPIPGSADGKKYLMVSYGVYGDTSRSDNDDQVILCYDTADWDRYARPLSQEAMHVSGPDKPDHKFFVRTGNTTWGVQNLEYDAHTGHYLMCVYLGKKDGFPNRPLYIVDGGKAPFDDDEGRERLSLLADGIPHESGVYSWAFRYGSTGLHAFGDGTYYVSHEGRDGSLFNTIVKLYRWDGTEPLRLAEE